MRFGLLGLIKSDRSDVTYESVAFARELGFRGLDAHPRLSGRTGAPPGGWASKGCLPIPRVSLAQRDLTKRAVALGIDVR